jgi:hypothetical protein
MRHRLLVSLIAIAAFVAACSTPVALRTAPVKTEACDEALLVGELVQSAQSGLAVRNADVVTEIVWPFGYTATQEANGIALRDDTGKVVAHVGQRVTMGGGGGADGLWHPCAGTIREVSNTGG